VEVGEGDFGVFAVQPGKNVVGRVFGRFEAPARYFEFEFFPFEALDGRPSVGDRPVFGFFGFRFDLDVAPVRSPGFFDRRARPPARTEDPVGFSPRFAGADRAGEFQRRPETRDRHVVAGDREVAGQEVDAAGADAGCRVFRATCVLVDFDRDRVG